MVVDVAGAAVGLALSVLYKGIEALLKHLYEKSMEFIPLLEKIKKKLKKLEPMINQMEKRYQEMDRPEELKDFAEVIKEGIALVNQLKERPRRYKKPKFTNKLKELDESLDTQMVLLGVQSAVDVCNLSATASNTEAMTRNIRMQVGKMSVQVGGISPQIDHMNMEIGSMGLQIGNLSTNQDTIVEIIKDMRQNALAQSQGKVGWSGAPEPPPFTVGLGRHVDELKKKLLDDGGSMALITGHAGSGKTTLAKSFCQDQKVKEKFKTIFVDVSGRPIIEVVQEICEKEERTTMSFQSKEIALDRLQQLLDKRGQDPVLLVLDNVWPGNRTDSLLAMFRFQNLEISSYKILMTSRFMLPGFDADYLETGELNDEDAMSLLQYTARLARSSFIPEDLQRQVVDCCKRLPLVIEVVGRSLFGKDIVTWKHRVEAWSSGSSVIRSNKDLLDRLQSSLDALGEENAIIKECFMDLASFPQGRRIPASVLVDMWTVLIDKWAEDKDSLCIAQLYELTYWRLVHLLITRNVEGEMDDYYGEHFVTQHDLLRELAIHQADEGPIQQRRRLIIDIRGKKLPGWWEKQMDQPFEARLVSISTGSLFKSKWRNIQLPKAKVLVLNFHTENYTLPDFVEKMEKLKVLIVTNHGFLPAEASNFTLLGLLSNLKRIRFERVSISSITNNPVELKRLQKISFFMCNVGKAFTEGSIKFPEAFPDLQEIHIDYCTDLVELPADICLLILLKKLSITNCHKLSALPEMIGELVTLEVLRLRSCSDLSELPSSVRKLKKLQILDISNCYSIKELPEHIGEMCCLEKLNMRQCSRLHELPESISDLEKLDKVICDDETKGLLEPHMPRLRSNIQIRVVKEEINLDWLPN